MNSANFHLKPWSPRAAEVANLLTNKIHVVAPELEVLFMGAAALGLPGKNDIDLDILCNVADIEKYTNKLKPVLGKPKAADDKLTVWNFELDGFEVDAILSDPRISHVPEQRTVFEKLKSNPALLAEYRKLKEACDGLPYGEYEKRKKAFFNENVLGRTK
jgi:GrpB-like predicted nucleotidyltransferase (UPF0157 family)